MRKLFTEADIIDLIKKGTRILYTSANSIFTPAALDKIRSAKISVEKKDVDSFKNVSNNPIPKRTIKKVALGCDHTGLDAKRMMIAYLKKKNIEIVDVGTFSSESCDYPDYAIAVAKEVLSCKVDFGIMLDATGIPSSITVNKLPGIRGATCYNEFSAKSAREHNNANVLVMGAKTLGEETLKSILDTWMITDFAGGRHQKRLDKITNLEEKLLKNK
ncbi:MAG: ribose 5-phosphate isomerase B [Bacteroidetes bacterium]|nr:ribose 5-phosphate isomerase B [Bacteroidota bacterium]